MKLGLVFVALCIVACGKTKNHYYPIPNPVVNHVIGEFGPTACFQNITADPSGNTYTIASLSFNHDGTGTNEFKIFSDNECTLLTFTGSIATTYFITRNIPLIIGKDLSIVYIDQGVDGVFYLPMVFTEYGMFVDINGVASYASEPSDTELAHLFPNPLLSQSILFAPRQ